jgi:hypothetical protein
MRALIRLSLAISVAMLLAFAPAANAAVLTWIEGNNVWIANPDGSGKKQLTTAGTAELPFRSPTSDDQGVVVAARDQEYFRIDQSGNVLNGNVAPMGPCSFGKPFPQPIAVDPTGEWVTYAYICNSGYPNFYNDFMVALSPAANAYATGNQIEWTSWYLPTWYGKRIVVSDSQKIFIQPATSNPPAPAAPSFGYAWIAEPGISLKRAAVNRAGTAVVLQGDVSDSSGNITSYLIWGRLPAGVPDSTDGTPADVADSCFVPVQGTPIFSGFSPDGSQITWSDDGGVKVSPAPTYNGTDQCTASPTVVAAGGAQPAFGAGTLAKSGGDNTTPPSDNTQQPPPAVCSACQNPGVATSPAIMIGKGSLKALKGKGLTVPVRCASACTIDLSLVIPRATAKKLHISAAKTVVIARGKRALTAAGTAKVVVKLKAAAKKRLRKVRKLKATLRAVVTGAGGAKSTAARTISLR